MPLALAMPLAGVRGLLVAATVAGLTMALALDADGASAAALGVGWLAFVGAGVATGIWHQRGVSSLRRVADLSVTDRLTGLFNYRFFDDALPRECERARRHGHPVSLVLLDVDHFKEFNDRDGHDAGNRLLAGLGETLRAEGRRSELTVRYGGEEFAVIVNGDGDDALAAAKRLREAVARVRVPVGRDRWDGVSASAGVAEHHPEAGDDHRALLQRADDALYAAKAAGRDRAVLLPHGQLPRSSVA